ncbi:MAG: acyl-CoA dehydrogenase family protein [Caulobacterales bacterium]
MDFNLTPEQASFRDSLAKVVAKDYSFERRRKIIAEKARFDKDIWALFAEQGLLALPFDPTYDGLGGSAVDMYLVMEAFGRALVVEPYLSCIVMAGSLLRHGASDAQKADHLPMIGRGERLFAVACHEPQSRYNLSRVSTTASSRKGGYVLAGQKSVVYGAPSSDYLLVSARTGGAAGDRGGVSLFVVPIGASGVSREDYATFDGMRASELTFENVSVGRDSLVGEEGEAAPLLERMMNEALAAVSAELTGAMEALNDRSLEHCRTRVAFEQPLSKFQVLQHRLVDMRVSYEHGAAISMAAARALDANHAVNATASAAMALAGREADFVGKNAIQLHGAIGITEDLDIGHYFRRIATVRSLFGDYDYHVRRYLKHRAFGGALS